MKFLLVCDGRPNCGGQVWIRGSYDASVNAHELDDNDPNWNEACEHIRAGDYIIKDEDYEDPFE